MPHSSVVSSAAPSSHATSSPFACSWKAGGLESVWVHVAGELDLATVAKLRETLDDAQRHARVVVLDLRELVFMDTSGVHLILEAAARARSGGGRLMLVRPPVGVDRVLTITGVPNEVLIFDAEPGESLTVAAGD
jgi:anti-sigma B factor antagonist